MMIDALLERGWCQFPFDPAIAAWGRAVLPAARAAVVAPEFAQWLRCGGTWFAGVNALGNDETGAVPGSPPLSGHVVDFLGRSLGVDPIRWDPAQVSVCYPGYPRQGAEETAAAFNYRRNRDAAHVDGLAREGPEKRRHLREPHAFILGLPLSETAAGAAPLVVWEGSQEIMRSTFRAVFASVPPERWGDVDVTDAYHAARRQVFSECRRVIVEARPGEAYLVHRLALHGVAPWAEVAEAGPDGRMIAYFRPALADAAEWLDRP